MKFVCPLSGIGYRFNAFTGLIGNSIPYQIHPCIVQLTDKRSILRQGIFVRQEFINSLSHPELVLAITSLLKLNPLIDFHSPVSLNSDNLKIPRENFIRLFHATSFCLSYSRLSSLPHYSINSTTSDLSSLFLGWLEEIESAKESTRKRFREETLSRMEKRFNRKLEKNLYSGKTIFHQLIDYKHLEWLFDCMSIPSDDWDEYRTILYNDVWQNLKVDKVTTRLLELEKYLEDWYSLGNQKRIVQKRIHVLISELLDLGAALPRDYYVADADGNIESTEYGKQDSFRKVIKPKLIFRPIEAEVTLAPISDRPKRTDYGTTLEYANALLAWNRKNIIR